MKPGFLPEGIEEWLPPDSWRLETLRRKLLDLYRARGYELILPPLLENLETLLTGAGPDLERLTFKLTDPAGGRLLGLRADMTPQAARIAALRYRDAETVRLCYLGSVLRAYPDSPGGPRSPRQAGCELFGDARIEADLEVLQLMMETLACAGIRDVHLDLGHVGVYRALAQRLNLAADDEAILFGILQRKSAPDLRDFAQARGVRTETLAPLVALMDMNGDVGVLARARATLAGTGVEVAQALEALRQAAAAARGQWPQLPIHVDLAELRGYRYETGIVFAAFVPGHGRELARGGRYDGAGRDYGVLRPAAGFSADLNELLRLSREKRPKQS